MTKAKSTASTLAIKPETVRSAAPSKMRNLAAQVQYLYGVMDEAERIKLDAEKRCESMSADDERSDLASLKHQAKTIGEQAWRKVLAIEDEISHAEPKDAVDAFITLMIYKSKTDAGEHWIKTALDAKTPDDRDRLIKQFDKETEQLEDMLAAALRALAKGLGVSAKSLGLGALEDQSLRLDLPGAWEYLKEDAKRLLV